MSGYTYACMWEVFTAEISKKEALNVQFLAWAPLEDDSLIRADLSIHAASITASQHH